MFNFDFRGWGLDFEVWGWKLARWAVWRAKLILLSGSPKFPQIALNFQFWLSLFCNFWRVVWGRWIHSMTPWNAFLIAFYTPLNPEIHFYFHQATSSSLIGVGDSLNGPEHHRPIMSLQKLNVVTFSEHDLAHQNNSGITFFWNFSGNFLTFSFIVLKICL